MRKIVSFLSLLYVATVLVVLLVMELGGDRWWLATLLLFGPRWCLALPLAILIPLATFVDRRQLLPLVVCALIVGGPLMGFCIPMGKKDSPVGRVYRVLTCNINGEAFDREALSTLVRNSNADIVALQECPQELGLKVPAGWWFVREGELALLSRFPLQSVNVFHTLHSPHRWPRASLLQCLVTTPDFMLRFCNVHLPSPRFGLQAVLDRKTVLNPARKELLISEMEHRSRVARDLSCFLAGLSSPIVIAGDFNMPVDSVIYRSAWGSYANAFSKAGFGYGWTVRGGVRGMEARVRIDHVLAGEGFGVSLCQTGSDVGSDHLPLIADIVKIATP